MIAVTAYAFPIIVLGLGIAVLYGLVAFVRDIQRDFRANARR